METSGIDTLVEIDAMQRTRTGGAMIEAGTMTTEAGVITTEAGVITTEADMMTDAGSVTEADMMTEAGVMTIEAGAMIEPHMVRTEAGVKRYGSLEDRLLTMLEPVQYHQCSQRMVVASLKTVCVDKA